MSRTALSAECRTNSEQTPDAPRLLIHERVNAIARSRMMTDARAIVAAARDLLAMLQAFGENHSANSIVAELRAADVEANESYLRGIARGLLSDCAGCCWSVEALVTFISSQVLDEDAGVLDARPRRSR